MRIKKKTFYLLILASIVLLIISSCNRSNQQSSSSANSSVTEYTVKKTNITDTVTVSGTIDTESSAEVKSLVSGVVKKVYVKEGDTVKAGDLLLELDDTDYQLAYIEALQNYELSKYTGSKLAVQQLQLKLDAAKRNLDRCKITSPIDGVVTEINYKSNDYVSNASVVAKVVNFDDLYVSASVEEIDYPKVKVGQTAIVTLDAFEDSTFPARVTYVGNQAQTTSGIVTVPIKLSLITQKTLQPVSNTSRFTPYASSRSNLNASGFTPNATQSALNISSSASPTSNATETEQLTSKIIPGLSCEADIVILSKQDVIVVPTSAISYEQGKAYVTVKNGDTTEKKQITLGEKFSSGYEIISGLEEGEVVVINKTSSSSRSSTSSRSSGGTILPVGSPAPVRGM